jgi:hypothetical protein
MKKVTINEQVLHEVVAEFTPVFKKIPNFLKSAPTNIEGALRLLSVPSGRF